MEELRILSPTAILGYGFPMESFVEGMKRNPHVSVSKLKRNDWSNCILNTRHVLQAAIEAGGTSVRSYTSSLGVTGLFQLNIHVYGRAQKPCDVCQTLLIRSVIGQRSSVYCPKCQKR